MTLNFNKRLLQLSGAVTYFNPFAFCKTELFAFQIKNDNNNKMHVHSMYYHCTVIFVILCWHNEVNHNHGSNSSTLNLRDTILSTLQVSKLFIIVTRAIYV